MTFASQVAVETGMLPGIVDQGVSEAPIPLDRDGFLRHMLRELTGTLEEVVGVEQASGYVAVVGGMIGEWINAAYHTQLGPQDFDLQRVAAIFVDLKRRIDGDFYIKRIDAESVVLGNRRCPFGEQSGGRPSLCMMTSNVFGRIAADNLGYARVRLGRTIAAGDGECDVTIFLRARPDTPVDEREYYRVSPAELAPPQA